VKKVNVNAEMFNSFRKRIATEFPEWKTQRRVQVIQNGRTVAIRPLNGYELNADEIAAIANIEADFAECEPAIEETHGWRPLNTPRRHYATRKQILRQLDKVRF